MNGVRNLEESLTSSYSTLALLVFREARLERGVQQGRFAQAFGVTPSAWSKIENGDSNLTFDAALSACGALGMEPFHLMNIVVDLSKQMYLYGWYFQTITLGAKEDKLLGLISRYFSSQGYQNLRSSFNSVRVSVIPSPFQPGQTPTVVRYCGDMTFRNWIDEGANGEPPSPPGFSLPPVIW
ncbi:helix-turn-helix domain-containing protein [Novosphingobium profundi]|uniref:helix-turn-helix domain-containing protein n=1 Tax=Novosphingobium profundi TaxID=1774954 RepID=UPI001CFC737B